MWERERNPLYNFSLYICDTAWRLQPKQVFSQILVPNFGFISSVGAIPSLVQFTFSAFAIAEQFTFLSIMSFFSGHTPKHSCLCSHLTLRCSCLLMRCLCGARRLCCLPCLVCWCLFLFCRSLGFCSLFKASLFVP